MKKANYSYSYPTFGVDYRLEEEPEPAPGTSNDDVLVGRNGKADVLNGQAGADVIRDAPGDYINIVGGVVTSDDEFYGGNGNDKLISRSGADLLDGGNGVDEFIFYANTDHARGRINYDGSQDAGVTIENADEGHWVDRLANGGVDVYITYDNGKEQILRIVDEDGYMNLSDILYE